MAIRQITKDGDVRIGRWKVERRLATARVEGQGPLRVEDECGGHCCRHGVYISLPERDRILEWADRVAEVMDASQSPNPDDWFEDEAHKDDDFEGGVCVGTDLYNDKCAFLNADGLCVLQLLEPSLELPEGERLKPFYCRLFPLTTWYDRIEFDDLCDGVRPCCTLASDGPTRAVDAYAVELAEILGSDGYDEFRREVEQLRAEQGGTEVGAGRKARDADRAKRRRA